MIAGLVIVIVVLVIVLMNRGKQSETAAVDPLRRESRGIDPRRLKVGDVVHHEGRDYLVRGTLAFDQDGFVWHEHFLDDTTTRRWLSVEDDEELEIVLWEAVTAPELAPGADRITHDGVTYTLEERGQATFRAEGTTGTAPAGRVEYYDYTAGAERLSFERYGGETWEIGRGHVLNERSLDIYPAARGT